MPTRSAARRGRRLALAALLALAAACGERGEDRLAEARALHDVGRFADSIELLRELVAREPEHAEAWYLLGAALAQSGEPSLAVFPLEKARAAPDHRVAAGLLLASTYVRLEAWDEAIRCADDVLAADPERSSARRLRALALLGAKRPEQALPDAQRLHEAAPDDYEAGLLHGTVLAQLGRLEEAERIHAALEEAGGDDPDTAARGCLAHASFLEDALRDDARAEARLRGCLERAPTHPLALHLATAFFDRRGRAGESLALWRRAVEHAPDSIPFREALALRLEAAGRVDEARAVLRDATEGVDSAAAWRALAEWEQRHGDVAAALAALAGAERAQPRRDESLLFLKGDLLVDAGRLDDAEALLPGFSDESYRELLRGRVLLARGDARAALAALDAGLRRWPDHAGARYLAALAARALGDEERAIAELREAVRADASATDAALALADLEAARGDARAALEAARSYVEQRGGRRPEAWRIAARAQSALGLHEAARHTADQLRDAGHPLDAALAAAEMEAAAAGGGVAGAAAAAAALRASGLDPADPEHERLLRALAEWLLAAGRGGDALAAVDAARARDPEPASLHALRGAVLLRLERGEDAQEAFEAAWARDPASGHARAGLAALAWARGDADRALALYDEAAGALPDEIGPAYAAARIALARGDRADARRRLEEIVRRQPAHAAASNDLAWLLASDGEELDRALALAERAHRLAPDPEVADTLGLVHLARGEAQAAVARFEESLAGRPDAASTRYHLGRALARLGERERAAAALREALAAGPFPEAEAAQRELARLESP
jgi:tetratricopeptide (TPR) repeat protein